MLDSLALANLDFEAELRYESEAESPSVRDDRRWENVLRLLPEARQAQCLSFEVAGCFDGVRRLIVWGVTPRTARLAKHLGLSYTLPPVSLVREVNDKRFAFQLEKQMDRALLFSLEIKDLVELEQAVLRCPYRWVLKHPLSFSSRARMLGQKGVLSAPARAWVQRRLERGWTLLFEPWVEQRRQLALHFDIDKGQQIRYVGRCRVVTDASGGFRGCEVSPHPGMDEEALRYARETAVAVARKGYWGPLTVESFRGTLAGVPVFRPLLDIDARYSFSRLALGLADWLPEDWCYFWYHPPFLEVSPFAGDLTPLPEPGQGNLEPGVYALPETVDPEQATGSAVLVSPTPFRLRRMMAKYLGPLRDQGTHT
jgi:hypothetical protein